MKHLKKFAAALLALTMTLSLAACGGTDTADDTADDTAAEGETTMYKIGISQYGEHAPWTTAGRASSRVWSRPAWWRT